MTPFFVRGVERGTGVLWTVSVDLEPIVKSLQDKSLLVDFLLKRSNSSKFVLRVVRDGEHRPFAFTPVCTCLNHVRTHVCFSKLAAHG